MKIIITHNQSTVDPSATVSDAQFPAVLAELERQYQAALLEEFPDAEIEFVQGDDTYGTKVTGCDDQDVAFDVQRITEAVYATGTFWDVID